MTYHLIFPDIDVDEERILYVRKLMLECMTEAGVTPQGTITVESSLFREQTRSATARGGVHFLFQAEHSVQARSKPHR